MPLFRTTLVFAGWNRRTIYFEGHDIDLNTYHALVSHFAHNSVARITHFDVVQIADNSEEARNVRLRRK